MGRYLLMNKNTTIAEFEVYGDKIKVIKTMESTPRFIMDIDKWVNERTQEDKRQSIQNLRETAGLESRAEILDVTKSIALTDTFWVKKKGSNDNWEAVNPYTNNLDETISNIAINMEYNGENIRKPAPEYVLDGTADKCWRMINDLIQLYKTTGEKYSNIVGNRAYIEYYVAQINRQLGLTSYVDYGIEIIKTENGYNKAYCICKTFTDENNGYAPIDITRYRDMEIEDLDKIMGTESRLILRDMLITDTLSVNIDRHMGNYGFMFNTNTLKIEKMAPLFDYDCSLGFNLPVQNKSKEQAYEELIRKAPKTHVNGGGFINQAKWAMTRKMYNNLKNVYPFKFNRIGGDKDLEEKRLDFMEYAINMQIREVIKATSK